MLSERITDTNFEEECNEFAGIEMLAWLANVAQEVAALEVENAELRKLLDSKTLNWEEQLLEQRDANMLR